ncbi:MAG: hypothetical protein OHK0039_32970 [Bacteroidia bacterium]
MSAPRRIWLLAVLCVLAQQGFGQLGRGGTGVGIEIGSPTGVSILVSQPRGVSVDMLAAWDLDDFFFFNAHALFAKDLGQPLSMQFFYGPGAFIGVLDRDRSIYDEVRVGISATAGFSLPLDPFELYVRLTPRLQLIDETEAAIGGGFGVRYYF